MASNELIKAVSSYEKYIDEKGVDEQAVTAYFEACKTAYLHENDLVYGAYLSNKCKEYINELIYVSTKGGNFKLLEEWSQKNKQEIALINMYYEVLKMEAPYFIDSYKLYIEKNRKRKDRFYEPRRKTLVQISQAIQDLEEDKLDILFLHQPPRTGKSGDITMDVSWHCARDTEASNLYVTYKEGLGGAFLDGVREIYEDPTYCFSDIFPDVKIVDSDAKNNKIDLNRKKKYKSLSGKGLESGLNGEYDATGWLVIDDPLEGIQDVLSKEVLKRKQTIFDNNVLSRKKENCKLILLGTLWSVNDLYGNYLDFLENNETGARYRIIRIPALNEKEESNFDYDYGVGFSTQYYMTTRAKHEMNNDLAGWQAQYMQNPIERDGTVFDAEQMLYYSTLPDKKPLKVIAHCDCALGGDDFLSCPVAFYYENDDGTLDGYVEDVVYDNSEKHITQPQVIALIKKYKIRNIHFESNQGGEGYKDDIETAIKGDRDYIEPCNITSSWAPSNKSKEQRIWDNAQDIRQLHFKDPQHRTKQYRMFMQNLFSFTMIHGKRFQDGAPDSLAGLVEFERNGSGATRKAMIMKVPMGNSSGNNIRNFKSRILRAR